MLVRSLLYSTDLIICQISLKKRHIHREQMQVARTGDLPKCDYEVLPKANGASQAPPSTAYQQNQERGPEGGFEESER